MLVLWDGYLTFVTMCVKKRNFAPDNETDFSRYAPNKRQTPVRFVRKVCDWMSATALSFNLERAFLSSNN